MEINLDLSTKTNEEELQFMDKVILMDKLHLSVDWYV